jgi:hypothetical protein
MNKSNKIILKAIAVSLMLAWNWELFSKINTKYH